MKLLKTFLPITIVATISLTGCSTGNNDEVQPANQPIPSASEPVEKVEDKSSDKPNKKAEEAASKALEEAGLEYSELISGKNESGQDFLHASVAEINPDTIDDIFSALAQAGGKDTEYSVIVDKGISATMVGADEQDMKDLAEFSDTMKSYSGIVETAEFRETMQNGNRDVFANAVVKEKADRGQVSGLAEDMASLTGYFTVSGAVENIVFTGNVEPKEANDVVNSAYELASKIKESEPENYVFVKVDFESKTIEVQSETGKFSSEITGFVKASNAPKGWTAKTV